MLPSAKSLEGKHVPDVTFKTRANNQWKDVSTDLVFKGRSVLVFCLPGAYTPTCSSTLQAVSGSGTWPQVFIGGKLIGTADDLEVYFDARKAA